MGREWFDLAYKKWTLAEFEAYVLNDLPKAKFTWEPSGITIHHTYNPDLATWKKTPGGDEARIRSTARYYQFDVDNGAGWTAGPHLFITDTHILQMTPLEHQGVHGGACNSRRWGFEVVGDYDNVYWPAGTERNVIGAAAALLRFKRLLVAPSTVNGHRDCPSHKTCPGRAISLDVVRSTIKRAMGQPTENLPVMGGKKISEHLIVIGTQEQTATFQQWRKYLTDDGVNANMITDNELQRIYTMCEWLNIDAAFLAAMWKQESFVDDPDDNFPNRPVIGGSVLQKQSHMPINMAAAQGEARRTVTYNDRKWLAFSSWQLGLMQAVIHLKDWYGGEGQLTIRNIVEKLAPRKDGNNPDQYVENVVTRLTNMAAIKV